MLLVDGAPSEEKRQELIKWVGVLILLNRQTTLKFPAQYTLVARLRYGFPNVELCKMEMDEYVKRVYENILQYLPKEVWEWERDCRALVVGCADKKTVSVLEEYYFQQTGGKIGKNDVVSLRVLEEKV